MATRYNSQLVKDGLGDIKFPLNGRIGMLSVYGRSLSASEVLKNYNATRRRFGV